MTSLVSAHVYLCVTFFFFNDTATTEIYTLSLHDALPISNNILAGDRNIMFGNYNNDNDKKAAHIIFKKKFTAKKKPEWTESLHENQGDLLLSDSSVQQASVSRLAQYMIDSSDANNEMMFPSGR